MEMGVEMRGGGCNNSQPSGSVLVDRNIYIYIHI